MINQKEKNLDRIEGDTIILYDKINGEKVLKRVKIIKQGSREIRQYRIIRTSRGGYLFN